VEEPREEQEELPLEREEGLRQVEESVTDSLWSRKTAWDRRWLQTWSALKEIAMTLMPALGKIRRRQPVVI